MTNDNEATFTLHHEVDDVQPLPCAARSPQGEIIGGIIGRTWGICCEMLRLWVDEPHRRRGIGGALVRQFHQQAESRGCRRFSFQAPEFSGRLGYDVRLELKGYSGDIVKYIMIREA